MILNELEKKPDHRPPTTDHPDHLFRDDRWLSYSRSFSQKSVSVPGHTYCSYLILFFSCTSPDRTLI